MWGRDSFSIKWIISFVFIYVQLGLLVLERLHDTVPHPAYQAGSFNMDLMSREARFAERIRLAMDIRFHFLKCG
jgi:hypothetical protein